MAIIAFDIDDTVADGMSVFLPTQNKHFKKNVTIDQLHGEMHELYGVTKEELLQYFVDAGPDVLPLLKPLPGAVELVNKLYDEGHQIYFITARPEFNAKEITIDWLDKYGFKYDELYFDGYKIQHCIDLGVDVIIDDFIKIIERAHNAGINSIFVDGEKNSKVKTPKGVLRAKNSQEIYDCIYKILNSK